MTNVVTNGPCNSCWQFYIEMDFLPYEVSVEIKGRGIVVMDCGIRYTLTLYIVYSTTVSMCVRWHIVWVGSLGTSWWGYYELDDVKKYSSAAISMCAYVVVCRNRAGISYYGLTYM